MSPGFGAFNASFTSPGGSAFIRLSSRILIVIAGVMGLSGPVTPPAAEARSWIVLPNGSGSAPTIQAAVDSAASGDTLDLSGGFFNERVTVTRKTLLIRGQGLENTEVSAFPNSGHPYGHAFALIGSDNFTEIRDLTISNGIANVAGDPFNGTYGGGVYGEGAIFALVRCRVTDCRANSLGAGIFATFEVLRAAPAVPPIPNGPRSAILIEDCLIDNNIAGAAGGGLYVEFALMEIRNCTFRDNLSVDAGGVFVFRSAVAITGSLFQANRAEFRGGGLLIEQPDPIAIDVSGNTFVANSSGRDGASVLVSIGAMVTIERNLFALSTGEGGGAAVACTAPEGFYTGGCNHFWSNGADLVNCGAIVTDTEGDPLFCDADSGDFRLCLGSPAIRDACGTAGAFGVGCEGQDCATPTIPTTWSDIKSRFR